MNAGLLGLAILVVLAISVVIGLGIDALIDRHRPPAWRLGQPLRARQPPRFSLRVGTEVIEGDSFGTVISALRERGYTTDEITAAALVVHRQPRGGELRR
jgi:hypothetical protein